jgi:methyltransferase OMS1, mitochondrial
MNILPRFIVLRPKNIYSRDFLRLASSKARANPIQYKPPIRTTRSPFEEAEPDVLEVKRRRRQFLYITGGGIAFLAGVYTTAKYVRGDDPLPSVTQNQDVSDRYDKIADGFDKEVGSTEFWLGIGLLRRWLVRKAEGHVLEVSVGTGRNSKYYKEGKCKSITMVDQSREMIEVAERKFKGKSSLVFVCKFYNSFSTEYHPKYKSRKFIVQSALEPIAAPPGGFDTVIQTMGLCSTSEPAELLRRMGAVTKAETGRILLLEHGVGHYDFVNERLDYYAPHHADKFGCWWNKDIGAIVEESGLEIVEIKRYHFGTTWWIELKPKAKPT